VPIPADRAVTVFHEGLAQVAQVTMFVVLGLLVFPSQLGDVAVEGTALALVLVFVARPIATFISTAPAWFTFREQSVLSWAGLRGACRSCSRPSPSSMGPGQSRPLQHRLLCRRLLHASTGPERAWWREVIGELAR
jgi:Sodium/hydrogen exchanger family